MLEVRNLRLPLDAGLDVQGTIARKALARALGVRPDALVRVRLTKRSVDARKKGEVRFVCSFVVELAPADERRALGRKPAGPVQVKMAEVERDPFDLLSFDASLDPNRFGMLLDERPLIVVGAGPAGLMCAWALARFGAKPVVVERGDLAQPRMEAIEGFNAGGALDPESNMQVGEGGAGLFSDGKLTTNIKSPRCKDVLRILVQAGAPDEILWRAKPHLGTDKLVGIVEKLRHQIEEQGGRILPRTRFEGFVFDQGKLVGVRVHDKEGLHQIKTAACVLACGHSARDTFEVMREASLALERKPFAVGVRIEHPQALIDSVQYGQAAGHPALGAADYKLAVHLPGGRGVYTFCMCPGGEVVCAASEEGGLCVNGMSRFARDGANANAGLLVGIEPSDLPGDDVLAGVELQRRLERAAFVAGGKTYAAPAQRVEDFLACRATSAERGEFNAVRPSHPRGVRWGSLDEVLPDFVAESLREALPLLDRRLPGFALPDAVMTAVEARSSSPVRILRDSVTLEASFVSGAICRGVFPCGEGAGYAGGIMSAAVDGLRVAEAVMRLLSGRQG